MFVALNIVSGMNYRNGLMVRTIDFYLSDVWSFDSNQTAITIDVRAEFHVKTAVFLPCRFTVDGNERKDKYYETH